MNCISIDRRGRMGWVITLLALMFWGAEGAIMPASAQSAGMSSVPVRSPSGSVPPLEGAGRIVAMDRMNSTESRELYSSVELRLSSELGYVQADSQASRFLPTPPSSLKGVLTMTRETGDSVFWIRFGHLEYLSRPSEAYLYGVMHLKEGNEVQLKPSSDLEKVVAWLEESKVTLKAAKESLTPDQLEYKTIQLSHIDPESAISALKGLGVNIFATIEQVGFPIPFAQLPVVTRMPGPKDSQTGLVGSNDNRTGAFDVSVVPSIAANLPTNSNSTPDMQLLVYYHPAYPEQFSRVRHLLDTYLDVPARQIFVEGMVLEISEEGLEELGVEWQFQKGNFSTVLGTQFPLPGEDTGFLFGDSTRNLDPEWAVRLRALIRENKAQVLSRPSILTLNNRQATIRVGTDIPIATSSEGLSGGNKISFNFRYLPTGILLNVRPRITEEGDQINMMIDILVSAKVPGADLEQRDQNRVLLASAPTISTRRVQTYARIKNNTPFIIGGLINRDQQQSQNRVPGLGKLPWIGKAFRSEASNEVRREVIIVLTPFVLEEKENLSRARHLPRDDDLFDENGNQLFRDTYRIREEDVFDLAFLLNNRRLDHYRRLARKAVEDNYKLADVPPFSQFANQEIPGESILVERMLYEVIKRLSSESIAPEFRLDSKIRTDNLIYFNHRQGGGYEVKSLMKLMDDFGMGKDASSPFEDHTTKAVGLTFTYQRESFEASKLLSEPVPQIFYEPCLDRKQWFHILQNRNQPGASGNQQYSIVINSSSDLVRLRRAVMLKEIIQLNGGDQLLSLAHFNVGRILVIPEIKDKQSFVLDTDVARYFYHTEQYYQATLERIEGALKAMEAKLQLPEFRYLLDSN